MSIVPGVMTDVWDFVSPAKSLDEFEPYKTSYVEGSGVENIDISPDGEFVVSITGRTVNFWNILKGDEEYERHVMNDRSSATIEKHEPYYNLVDIEFSAIGNYYLVGSNSYQSWMDEVTPASRMTLYNMTHSIGVASRTFRTRQINDTLIEDTAISPDETTYAACTEMTANPESCTINFWGIETGEVVNSITYQKGEVVKRKIVGIAEISIDERISIISEIFAIVNKHAPGEI
jgi:WD40 repeat protein